MAHKVAFVVPGCDLTNKLYMENLGVEYLAAVLKQNQITSRIWDIGITGDTIESTINQIIQYGANLIGISVSSVIFYEEVKNIVNEIRTRTSKIHICVGGYYPTSYPELLKELNITSVFLGEGEDNFAKFAKFVLDGQEEWKKVPGIAYLCDGELVKNKTERHINLNEKYFLKRETLKSVLKNGGVASILGSRGCYGNCTFCLINSNYLMTTGNNNWYGRTGENIVNEIEDLHKRFGLKEFWFIDANFFGGIKEDKNRIRDLCKRIKNLNYKISFSLECRITDVIHNQEIIDLLVESGLKRIFLGVESGDSRELKIYNKGTTVEQNIEAINYLKNKNIAIHVSLIYFNPFSSFQSLQNTINFIYKCGLEMIYPGLLHNILGVLPGTPIFKIVKNNDININNSGVGYTFSDNKVEIIYKSIFYLYHKYQSIQVADHILWRNKAYFNDNINGIQIEKKINYLKNRILLSFYESIVRKIIKEKDNFSTSKIRNIVESSINEILPMIEELKNTIRLVNFLIER
mgnify:CR=1 FL=1